MPGHIQFFYEQTTLFDSLVCPTHLACYGEQHVFEINLALCVF